MTWRPEFSQQQVVILKEEQAFSGYCKIKQFELQFPLFEGGTCKPVERELICRPAGVAVLLYDPKTDKVVMIEQFRVGALSEKSPWILEIVAGVTEQDESIEETARREVWEEAGCEAFSLTPILGYLTSPGILNEKIYIYCAIVEAPLTGQIHGIAEEGEDIKIHVLSSDEVFKLLEEGKIISSPSIIALQWLKLNRADLRSLPKIE